MSDEEETISVSVDNDLTMKENLIAMAMDLTENGIDLKETPAIFRWTYQELPTVLFQVMISGGDNEVPDGETIQ